MRRRPWPVRGRAYWRGIRAALGVVPVSDRRVHFSVWLVFFVNGAVLSSWAPRIPDVAAELRISDAHLGVALLGIAGGAIPAMASAKLLARHVPVTWVCMVSAAMFVAGLPLIALAHDTLTLMSVLVLLGVASGLCDVSMNVTGIALQHHRRRALLSGLHSGYSLGVMSGASGAVAATFLEVSVAAHFGMVALVLFSLTAFAAHAVLRSSLGSSLDVGGPSSIRPRLVTGEVSVAVVGLAICGLLLEGLVTDWSALLLVRDFDSPPRDAAVALTLFSAAMFTSRAMADRVLGRLGERAVLRGGALLTTIAISFALIVALPEAMIIAIVLTGLAIGPVFPLAISRAAAHGDPAATTARISILGYTAYLAGPPLIGLLAQAIGLPTAFTLTAIAAAIGIALAATPPGHRT